MYPLFKTKRVHCFFEQSGIFKNEFLKLGFKCYDYDILNEFEQTDFIIDLFNEINNCYNGMTSIFDTFTNDDLIMAFFPCTRFENQILLWFNGNEKNLKHKSLITQMEKDLQLHYELHDLYVLITKLVIICCRKNLKLIIENPYSSQHYLVRYWALKASIIDYDRRRNGDYFKKPTQYFFVNCEPVLNNLLFECYDVLPKKTISYTSSKTDRSLISSIYANRFIRTFLKDND